MTQVIIRMAGALLGAVVGSQLTGELVGAFSQLARVRLPLTIAGLLLGLLIGSLLSLWVWRRFERLMGWALGALEHVMKKRIERRYVLTRFDSRRGMSHRIAAQLTERFGTELCLARIAENVALAESPAQGRDVFSHAPGSRGARDYETLLEELLSTGFWEV